MTSNQKSYKSLFYLILLFTFAAYFSGLFGPKLLDDYAYINQPQSYIHSFGEQGRFLYVFFLQLESRVFGDHLFGYKLVNLLIHLFNGYLLFQFTKIILPKKNPIIAFFAASLWVAHPLLLSTVLYTIQGGTLLASTFILLGLLWCLHIENKFNDAVLHQKIFYLLVLHGLGLCAILCKETGALLYVYLWVVTILKMPVARPDSKINSLFWFGILLPLFTLSAYLLYHLPQYLLFYRARDFSLSERLMTESLLLFQYLEIIFWPRLSAMWFNYDALPIVHHLNFLVSCAISFWVAITVFACCFARRFPIICFCILWFVGSHLLESTVLPLELGFEHRNYLAVFACSFLFSYLLAVFNMSSIHKFCRRVGGALAEPTVLGWWVPLTLHPPYSRTEYGIRASIMLLSSCLVILLLLTDMRAFYWRSEKSLFKYWVHIQPNSKRANQNEIALLLFEKKPQEALAQVEDLQKLYPDDPAPHLYRIYTQACVLKQRLAKNAWDDLNHAVSKMRNPTDFLYFANKLVNECPAEAIKPLAYTLRIAEQNAFMFGLGDQSFRAKRQLYRIMIALADTTKDTATEKFRKSQLNHLQNKRH